MGALPDPPIRYGTYQGETFTISGDFHEAYLWLEARLNPKTPSKSGPIKPLSSQEKLAEQNPVTADLLQNLPTSNFE